MLINPVIYTAIAVLVTGCIAFISVLVTHFWHKKNDELSIIDQYFADILEWANESLFLFSEGLHLCDLVEDEYEGVYMDRHKLLVKISALWDKGRWFFPNFMKEEVGIDKESAFRGYRPLILDTFHLLYASVRRLKSPDDLTPDLKKQLVEAKRLFTSEVQRFTKTDTRRDLFKVIMNAEYHHDLRKQYSEYFL